MFTRLLRILFVCLVALLLPGCKAADEAPADNANEPAEPAPAPVDVYRPDAQREVLPSNRIYYTLTDFAWYARGEPLVHGGAPYLPSGMPVAASVTEMTRAGEYDGVEFYTRTADSTAVVYVPVFQGYWQVFRADSAAPAALPVEPDGR